LGSTINQYFVPLKSIGFAGVSGVFSAQAENEKNRADLAESIAASRDLGNFSLA
jgi:hypothetical protein